jgi:hypothetical protein
MSTDSHRERVAAVIRISSQPLDDDQIAARTGISPRQTVNQICRALEHAGMVRRRPGPDGKIFNEGLGAQDRNPEAPQRRRARPCTRKAHLPIPPSRTGPRLPEILLSSAVRNG